MGVIGNAAQITSVPSSTTPNPITTPATTATTSSVPQATVPISNTTSSAGDVMSMIDAAVKPNVLNAYYQSTYHIRLFLAPDMDILSQSKATDIQGLNTYLASVSQVTIAETGVTGFNIKDMQITTVNSGNDKTRNAAGTIGSLTITEANGLSFMDGLVAAANQLKVYNFLKVSYYLEVTFKGYDANGVFTKVSEFSTGGRWIWAIKLQDIQAKLNEGGGVYTITFSCNNQSDGVSGSHDLMVSPQPFHTTGDTLAALFTDYIKQLNVAWATQYGGDIVVFDKIDTKPCGSFFAKPATATTMDPGTFKLKPDDLDRNPNRNWKLDDATGAYTVTVPTGYRVQDFIVDAIKHTIEGQQLIKDNNKVADQVDQSGTSVNDRGHRESIIWSVEVVQTQNQFDTTSGNYIKHITFYVVPHYQPWAVSSRTQVNQANSQSVQQDKVQSLITNGFLRKRYDYIFTGLNTEIIDFDISFNTNFDSLLPVFNGAEMKNDAVKTFSRTNSQAPAASGNQSAEPKPTPATLTPPNTTPPPTTVPASSPPAAPPPAPAAPSVSITPDNFVIPGGF